MPELVRCLTLMHNLFVNQENSGKSQPTAPKLQFFKYAIARFRSTKSRTDQFANTVRDSANWKDCSRVGASLKPRILLVCVPTKWMPEFLAASAESNLWLTPGPHAKIPDDYRRQHDEKVTINNFQSRNEESVGLRMHSSGCVKPAQAWIPFSG